MNVGNMPFTYNELQDAVADGRVTKRSNSDDTLDIYNYSDSVQYTNKWDNITLNCRGLILDKAGNIVARPWAKFFNLGQVELPIQFDTPVEVMDKADGSLGILYKVYGTTSQYRIATRGSFDSEQAWHASKILNSKYQSVLLSTDLVSNYLLEYTFLFEIIYPKNRIVLNYEGMDDLMLLGAVEKKTGYYLSPIHAQALLGWTGPVVETYGYKSISEALGAMGRKNKEGFVIRSHNFMVKVKEPDYLDLHRLVTNISAKNVWEQLKHGHSKEQIISQFPDEFHTEVEGYIDPLLEAYEKRADEITMKYITLQLRSDMTMHDRKQFAMAVKKDKDARYMFLMLDNKSIRDTLWQELKPKEKLESRV